MTEYKVDYDSNNSGGYWWLKDEDWKALEKAGWEVHWYSLPEYATVFDEGDGRFIGALACGAHRIVKSPDAETARMAVIHEFEELTGQDAEEEGCPCCGQPHWFDTEEVK